MAKKILLNAFDMNTPSHQSNGLWRHPRDKSYQYNSMVYWQDLARTLERGFFDGIFLADVTGIYDVYKNNPETALRSATQVPANDPFTLVPVMAAVTEHLSFGVTGSIPYLHPTSFSRMISSLDHLTNGRIAWNIVTGYLNSAAKGTGKKQQDGHDTRYDIAAEFLEVTYKLWEGSWEDDAVVRDAERGIYTDPSKVHTIQHDGEYFALEAIHLCEPSPQRTPVIYQAGASPKGQAFAAAHAECVFVADGDRTVVTNFVRGIRQQMQLVGRPEESLKFFALAATVVAPSDAEAEAKFNDYQQYGLHEGALALVSGWTGIDMSLLDIDGHVEDMKSEAIQTIMTAIGARSVREWAKFLVVGGAAPVFVGSAETVADKMQTWMEETDVDGFNMAYTVMPEGINEFVELVVPELQRRGIYKTAYTRGTVREKLFGRGPRLQAPHPAVKYRV